MEEIEEGKYRRAISLQGNDGYLEVSLDESRHALEVRVAHLPRLLFRIIERVRAMFDLDADCTTTLVNARLNDPRWDSLDAAGKCKL